MTVVHSADQVIGSIPTEQAVPPVLAFPPEIAAVLLKLGEVEWGATAPSTPEKHGLNTINSVNLTAENFGQSGPQEMHGLYLKGTETVLCHTGTSPNSPNTARALTAAWNHMVQEVRRATTVLETGAVGTSNASEPNTPAVSS